AGAAGLRVGGVEAGADLLLQARHRVAIEPPGRHVDLEIELPKLGRPRWVGDSVEHGGVAHGRRPAGVHEVQLDLHAHLRRVGLEQAFLQHPCEDLQRAPYLVAVLGPVLAADLDGLNVTTHEASAHRVRESMYPARHPLYTFVRYRATLESVRRAQGPMPAT